ncbi:hypothetical protein [Methylobacterium sp. GC_Met_2]|uniref:hypothetical protein n=1 Tax=Methylobacterium sp. GC_Met_2 TaxID=2937376 RepID=UPI00226B7FFA|nr:hypothetical protein [Methylobacterium sp. GC_Met_2]
MTSPNLEERRTERLPDLDDASLACMHRIAKLADIPRNQDNTGIRNSIQFMVREAMRAVLPPDDPRLDPDYPFNLEKD